jgi:hypothetical protein
MAKTEYLQIRLRPEDRERLRQAAAAEYLDVSTWARQVLLKAVADGQTVQSGGETAAERKQP